MKKSDRGQGLLEYIIIIALVVVISLLALQLTGMNVREAYCRVVGSLDKTNRCSNLCQDDLTSLSGWNAIGNRGWEIRNGMLCNNLSGEQQALNRCSQTSSMPSDYTINMDGATLYSGNGYGVFFRLQDTPTINGYVFQYDPGLGGRFIIRKWVNGNEINNQPVAMSNPYPQYNWTNQPRSIKVVVRGNTFTAYVDGQLVLTGTDSTYTSGGSGLRTWDSTSACFDSFSISQLQ